jgi:hypothetical protein
MSSTEGGDNRGRARVWVDKALFAGTELDVETGKRLIAIQGADGLGVEAGAIAIAIAIAIAKQIFSALSS